MISWLARRTWGKFLLIPVAVAVCAFKMATYANGAPADKAYMWANAWGWLGAALQPAWWVLGAPTNPEYKNWRHALTDVLVEWTRGNAQLAAKLYSLIIVVLFLLMVLGWAL